MRIKEVKQKIKESADAQQLMEINMSPSSLRQLAAKIDARAGMEFEMIVPDLDDSEDELEADYNMDESVSSISDAVDFFNDGEHNDRRDVKRLHEKMEEDFFDWQSNELSSGWDDEGRDLLREYIENNDWDEDRAMEEAVDEIKNANPELLEGSPEFDKLVNNRVSEMLDEKASESWESRDRNFEYAREE